ncbi:MAG: hypothetical protein ACJ8GN_28775 [Longimicrobiaceae bacterium]
MDDFIGMIAVTGGILIVLIPIAGLTARFALKPLIESVTAALRARQGGGEVSGMERRMAQLEEEVTALRGELRRVSDGAAFDRRLAESAAETPRAV